MEKLFRPVDAAWLVFFRPAFGLLMLGEMMQYFQRGWIQENYLNTVYHFKFYGFSWVTQPPGQGMVIYFFVLALLAICMAVGYRFRVAAILFFLGYTYMWLIDETIFVEWNYLISLITLLLILSPAGKIYSLSNLLDKTPNVQAAPAWLLYIFRFQIAVVYIFGGLHKLNADWIRGDMLRGWLGVGYPLPFAGRIPIHDEWLIQFLTWAGIGIDLFIVLFLLIPRTRLLALIVAIAFHLNNAHWFSVGIFPYLMIIGTCLFLEPSWFRKVFKITVPQLSKSGDVGFLFKARRPITLALILYIAIQILVPLRHFLYQGNPNWTEEGVRLSWFLYSRNKFSDAQFTIVDGRGTSYTINKEQQLKILTGRQYFFMTKDPGLIQQFAQYLGQELKKQGVDVQKISAQTLVRMNMREPRPIIDPNINLLDQPLTLSHKKWITDAP